MPDHDETPDRDTPASPSPAPAKAHGDAFLDQSGSRQGAAPADDSEEAQDDD